MNGKNLPEQKKAFDSPDLGGSLRGGGGRVPLPFWGEIQGSKRFNPTGWRIKNYPQKNRSFLSAYIGQNGRRMAYIGPSWARDSGRMTWGTSWNGG